MIQIEQAILHEIVQREDGQLICRLRPQPLLNGPAVETMLTELHQTYSSKSGKGFGYFLKEDETLEKEEGSHAVFADTLSQYRNNDLGFVEFSAKAGELLQTELAKYNFAQGGFLLLASYTAMASDYLFVALLNAKSSMTVLDDMELTQVNSLDLSNMQLAARIDLTEWQQDKESRKYISFIRGRAGRKVADFFLDFMGCGEGIVAKQQTKNLMAAVEDFVSQSELTQTERQQCREKVFEFCAEKSTQGDEVDLKGLAEELAASGMDSFYDFASSEAYELEETFPADRTTLRQLKKFSGTGAGVSIGFDSSHLGDRVIYDPVSDTLLIKGVPANLKDQLARRLQAEAK